ncbi:MAG: D-alanine--D-alanine ligase [Cytophagales bacterium]|nr:D-alanine--D-alanine ligase [Cytophagales bacterium]
MRTKVGILFGGRSVEHEVSLLSAVNVVKYLDQERFEPVLIGIDKEGKWHLGADPSSFRSSEQPLSLSLNPALGGLSQPEHKSLKELDVVFPVLHGTDGEDGSIQGLFKAMDVPVVGSGVLGSALCMDKIFSKKILESEGIPVAKYVAFHKREEGQVAFEDVVEKIGLPFIAKPATLGSSVGVSKVKSEEDFKDALQEIFQFDQRVLLEEFVTARELECAVMGNHEPVASAPGEVLLDTAYEFYSFEAKYVDKQASQIIIPALMSAAHAKAIKEYSVKAYQALGCEDFARVDIFLKEDGQVLVNEINTIPGFTNISMFPGLWANEGIAYRDLLTHLIKMALDRNAESKLLQTHFNSGLNN